jgi:uncharacterized membrane protein YfcA
MVKNWKTTLVGAVAGALIVVLNLIQTGTVDVKTLAIAFGLALIGALAKDFNVTGV